MLWAQQATIYQANYKREVSQKQALETPAGLLQGLGGYASALTSDTPPQAAYYTALPALRTQEENTGRRGRAARAAVEAKPETWASLQSAWFPASGAVPSNLSACLYGAIPGLEGAGADGPRSLGGRGSKCVAGGSARPGRRWCRARVVYRCVGLPSL